MINLYATNLWEIGWNDVLRIVVTECVISYYEYVENIFALFAELLISSHI